MTSRFSHHESCPVCGSKDNLGVWEDGHKFCFGCKYYEAGELDLKQVFQPKPEEARRVSDYPTDATEDIPAVPLKWLLTCGIDFSKQKQFGIMWSPSRQMVCWKIYNPEGKFLAWQGRNFNKDLSIKYAIYGKVHDDICILGNMESKSIVLVEDYLSTIRVSTHLPCMSLFGCTCSLAVLQQLKTRFTNVKVWLDSDKLDNARKIGLNANLMGLSSQVLFTPKDPKEYTDSEIKEFLEVVK